MPLTAQQFLDRLEQQGVLDDKIIASLRRQLADSKSSVSAEAVAKLLVEKGQLSAYLAERYLDGGATADDELGFAPSADDPPAADDDDVVELMPAAPTPAPQASRPQAASAKTSSGPVNLTPLVDDDEVPAPKAKASGLSPLTDGDLTEVGADAGITPLGDLGSVDPLTQAAGLETSGGTMPAPGQPAPQAGFKGKRSIFTQWDSPWWWILGVAVLALGIFCFYMIYYFSRDSAQKMFDIAEETYQNANYPGAVERYENFLGAYPSDKNASKAKVKRNLARIRIPVGGRNWPRALEDGTKYLKDIEEEEDFGIARDELLSILPKITRGFVDEAEVAIKNGDTKKAKEQLALADEAQKLVDNPSYLPTSKKKSIERTLAETETLYTTVEDKIIAEEKLVEAIRKIEGRVADAQTVEAFKVRAELIERFRRLEGEQRLVDAVRKISAKEQELVEVGSTAIDAINEDRPRAAEATVILASNQGNKIEGLESRVAAFLVSGAVYALNVATGDVVWRRFVGYETTIQPQRASSEPGADFILVDQRTDEVVRVEANSGKLVWRLPVGEPFYTPVISRDRIYVTTRSGRVLEVDPPTGDSARHSKLPQGASAGTGIHSSLSTLYQAGEHSNIYVLSASDLECRDVYYLAHGPGSVEVPPIMTQEHLFIAENTGPGASRIHVLRAPRAAPLERAQAPFDLRTGQVKVPPIIYNRRLIVLTDLGAIHVYEVTNDETKPVEEIKYTATETEPVIGSAVADLNRLWVTTRRLSAFDIQAARGQLTRSNLLKHEGDTFVAPLTLFGETVLHVRRHKLSAGVSVTAAKGSNGEEIWRTDLAVPLAGPPPVDAQQGVISAITAQAELFQVEGALGGERYINKSDENEGSTELNLVLTERIEVGDGRSVFSGPPGDRRFLLFDPAKESRLDLKIVGKAFGARTTAPVPFAGGLLYPSDVGQVLVLNPSSAAKLAESFQPKLQPGQAVVWHSPAVADPAGNEFVVADNRQMLYRVGLSTEGTRHLSPIGAPIDFDKNKSDQVQIMCISPLAATSETVAAIVRKGSRDAVVTFALPDLKPGPETPLEGRQHWGPERVGNTILIANEIDGLMCFDSAGSRRWAVPMKHGPLVGVPLLSGGDFVFACQNGVIWRVAATTGQDVGIAQLDEPLAVGPVELGSRLLVGTSDGTLQIVPLPTNP